MPASSWRAAAAIRAAAPTPSSSVAPADGAAQTDNDQRHGMSKGWGRALTALVNGVTAPQHGWRRAHTRLRVAAALHQTSEVATRHGTLLFVSTHTNALMFPQYHATREPETLR